MLNLHSLKPRCGDYGPFVGETLKGFLTQKPKNYIMGGLCLNRLWSIT